MQVVGSRDAKDLIERTVWSGEFSPYIYWEYGLTPIHLYWHPKVIQTAMRIPIEMNFQDGQDKAVLRKMAVDKKILPKEVAYRKKLGMTNGTSINQILSDQLNLSSPHAYREKNRYTINKFQESLR